MSDIVNDGRYTTRDATIDVRFGSGSDGSLLIFAIEADGALLAADLGSVAFARSLDAPAWCAEPP